MALRHGYLIENFSLAPDKRGLTMVKRVILFLCFALSASLVRADITVKKAGYQGWQNCYRVSNGNVELIVTADVGPRIIRYGFVGGQNLFKEYADQLGRSGEPAFQLRGGVRVWKAPEDPVATWAPDNSPVAITATPNGLIARAPVEPLTHLQKEIEVRMEPSGTAVTVIHRITNRSLFPLEFSPWVLTMMAPGGLAISGFPPRGKHPANLEATNPLVMWAYTNLSDKRWTFTRKYLALKQDARNPDAQKLGMFNRHTWAAYVLNGEAFIKQAQANPSETYPDFGCSFETFTNNEFLEIETLGPMSKVLPGNTTEQTEYWSLYRGVQLAEITDDAIDKAILPLLNMAAAPD
jgi:hypothetical protein